MKLPRVSAERVQTRIDEALKQRDKEWVDKIEECQMPDTPSSEPYPGLILISKARWQAIKKEIK